MGDPKVYDRTTVIDAREAHDFTQELNPEQAAAATFGNGPLLIVAGAGTGKTRTLVYRVAHLLLSGVPAERILLLTFTRRAAQEMLARAVQLVGGASKQVHGGTFHGTAHRLLRRFGPAAGLSGDFTIMDQGDTADLMQLSRAKLGYGDVKRRFPRKETLHYVYSRHVNTEVPVAEILAEEFPRFSEYEADFSRIYADFTERKSERNLVDYDDLLVFWCLLLEHPALGRKVAALYDHVLVDEYQDTNVLQARILRGLCGVHRNITVVGDDAQSIYSFRGASFRNILEFPREFEGTTMIALEQNYRSTQPILDASNTLISRASERFTKNLWTHRDGGEAPWLVTTNDEQEQTRFVVERILELHEEGIPLSEMAVLFRAAYMSADLEIELTNRKIPFEKWGGLKFLEAAHVKDVLAFLRVIENPRDEVSWFRLLQLLPGIGEATARSAIASMAEASWSTESFEGWLSPPRARQAHTRLAEMLTQLRRRPSGGNQVAADITRVRVLYDDILRERYDRVEPRLSDLDQLQVIAGGYPDRGSFLAAIALEPPQGTQDLATGSPEEEDDALILSTVHSAKGKEWDAVFVIWAVDGWFPMARAIGDDDEVEEERRLMYVAMTRARDHLAVTYPLNAYSTRRGSDYTIDQLSRFIDPGVRETMQRVVPKFDDPARPPVEPVAALDLRELMKRRFAT